jgi:hypothetical protein
MKKPFDIFMMEAPDALAVHWGWALFLGLAIGTLVVLRLSARELLPRWL